MNIFLSEPACNAIKIYLVKISVLWFYASETWYIIFLKKTIKNQVVKLFLSHLTLNFQRKRDYIGQ